MRIEYLYRYPVKGLSAEALDAAEVAKGGAIPWDRAFALAQGDASFDPEHPAWLPKTNFMCQMKNARIAALQSVLDSRTGRLAIRAPDGSAVTANALSAAGREEIGRFLTDFLGPEARGAPRFHYVPGHVFCDQRAPRISLINLASLRDFEARLEARRHRRRFRANVWFSGAPAWSELDWVGREIQLGGAVLRVAKRITRCPATEVNPLTAERDANPVEELRRLYGHADLGIHAEVIEGGRFEIGDGIELLPE
ncbi:MAG TPA: MOSC N-terminal beta barrel domain-containing protein [Acetobacteraceae bacterium]|nr:MOSC N-terminal beta barrel domain-containing protein [Acetobacteraceae bacterium]